MYKTCDIEFVVRGSKNIPPPPFVIVSNHQGQWETFFFQYYFFPLTTLLKKELLFIPFWGWALAFLSPISINRKNPKLALKKALESGEQKLKKGFLVLFFPEGTRNKPGEVGKFARSSFELAKRSSVPVLPLAHNSGLFWPAHRFLKSPGKIILKIGKPLTNIQSTKEASKEVEDWTRQEVSKMG